MHYLGGKSRFCAEIGSIIRRKRRINQTFLVPFCGAAWVTQHLYPGRATATDISAPLINMHRAVQQGWEPPDIVTEEWYNRLHSASIADETTPLIGFVGFGCSWGGKWWGGYARGDGRNYCLESKTSLLKKHKYLQNVDFLRANYKNLQPNNCCIYCDPPYAGTTNYGTDWDSIKFWAIMRKWSLNNTVVISEYKAPSDFEIIWEHDHFSFQGTNSKPTTERLFQWNPVVSK